MHFVRLTHRNSHVREQDLFSEIDSYYSLVYSSPEGNVRGHYKTLDAGQEYRGKVFKKRLNYRTEVRVNWHILTADALVVIIGESFFYKWIFFEKIKKL